MSANCVLDLINRQKAEIEKLNKENENLLLRLCKKVNQESKAIEKLTKSEAYKEFAEEIENINLSDSDDYFEFKRGRFDNLLKELVGEDDGKL